MSGRRCEGEEDDDDDDEEERQDLDSPLADYIKYVPLGFYSSYILTICCTQNHNTSRCTTTP